MCVLMEGEDGKRGMRDHGSAHGLHLWEEASGSVVNKEASKVNREKTE